MKKKRERERELWVLLSQWFSACLTHKKDPELKSPLSCG